MIMLWIVKNDHKLSSVQEADDQYGIYSQASQAFEEEKVALD